MRVSNQTLRDGILYWLKSGQKSTTELIELCSEVAGAIKVRNVLYDLVDENEVKKVAGATVSSLVYWELSESANVPDQPPEFLGLTTINADDGEESKPLEYKPTFKPFSVKAFDQLKSGDGLSETPVVKPTKVKKEKVAKPPEEFKSVRKITQFGLPEEPSVSDNPNELWLKANNAVLNRDGSIDICITEVYVNQTPDSFKKQEEPVIGQRFEGGFYTGDIIDDGIVYHLIVAPRGVGRNYDKLIQWKTTNDTAPETTRTLTNGLAATLAMVRENEKAGEIIYPAAQYCYDLEIDGYKDWYLPALDELELVYRNLKPTTNNNFPVHSGIFGVDDQGNGYNVNSNPPGTAYTASVPTQTGVIAFQTGGSDAFVDSHYWSSTKYENQDANILINFSNGFQGFSYKSGRGRVCAFRRVRAENQPNPITCTDDCTLDISLTIENNSLTSHLFKEVEELTTPTGHTDDHINFETTDKENEMKDSQNTTEQPVHGHGIAHELEIIIRKQKRRKEWANVIGSEADRVIAWAEESLSQLNNQ